MQSFPSIDPDEERVLTFDFTLELLPNEVLQGTPVVKVTLSAGTDPNPSNVLIAPPTFDQTGLLVLQPVGNLSALDGNDYAFEAICSTTAVDKTVVIRGLLPVRSN